MAEHEKKPLLLSSDSEEYGCKFDTFPRNDVHIQEGGVTIRWTRPLDWTSGGLSGLTICETLNSRNRAHNYSYLILMCFLSFGENRKVDKNLTIKKILSP